MDLQLDYIALVLILLQLILLVRIARALEGLNPAKIAEAIKASQSEKQENEIAAKQRSKVCLDELDATQKAMLARGRTAYLGAGGELDELWEPFLLRFYVNYNWNEEVALEKMTATARWRRDQGVDAIRRRYASGKKLGQHPSYTTLLNAIGAGFGHRRALDGDMLSVVAIGHFSPDVWFRTQSDDEYYEISLHVFEWLMLTADALSAKERYLCRQTMILDYDGLSWQHLNPRIFFRMRPEIAVLAQYYPECMGAAICINTPGLFSSLWAIVSPWLSEGMRKRIVIVDAEKTKDAVLQLAPPASLPRIYGGTCDTLPEDVKAAIGIDGNEARLRGMYDGASSLVAAVSSPPS